MHMYDMGLSLKLKISTQAIQNYTQGAWGIQPNNYSTPSISVNVKCRVQKCTNNLRFKVRIIQISMALPCLGIFPSYSLSRRLLRKHYATNAEAKPCVAYAVSVITERNKAYGIKLQDDSNNMATSPRDECFYTAYKVRDWSITVF